tara:strand:- start:112 stop:732 length:621 start_codon:yes stop_codon:yes gene_type:complete
MQERPCNRCGETKPLSEFCKKKGGKFGRNSICKPCAVIKSMSYYTYKDRPPNLTEEEKRLRRKAHYEENKEEFRKKGKIWREANAEKKRAADRLYTKNNPDKRRESSRNYNQSPKGKYVQYKLCSAKQRGLTFDLTMEEFESFWGKPCSYCGAEIETIGLDRMDNDKGYAVGNITPCCKRCNVAKLDRPLSEWLKKIGKTIEDLRI